MNLYRIEEKFPWCQNVRLCYHASMSPDRFEQLVERSLDELPDRVIEALDNVAICIEATSEDGDKLGEYVGVPRVERSDMDIALLPDRIILYQTAIEEECGDDAQTIEEEIRRTIWHEIAHHLGWDEDALEEAEARRGWHANET